MFSKNLLAQNINYEEELQKALTTISAHSIVNSKNPSFDWKSFNAKAIKDAKNIHSENEFTIQLTQILKKLDDNHSFVNDIAMQNDMQQNPQNYNKMPDIIVKNGIGIIRMPTIHLVDPNDYYSPSWVKSAQAKVKNSSKSVTKGWIIDLTENYGGNMYPMIAALGYFINTKELGGFYFHDEDKKMTTQNITYENGDLKFNNELTYHYDDIFEHKLNNLPLAILVNEETASSAEFLALALGRQENAKIIGKNSFGIATVNMQMPLPKELGGYYMLTIGYYLDKNNKPLTAEKVIPDIYVKGDNIEAQKIAMKYIESIN